MLRRKRALDSLDQDMRDHIERETQEHIDRGLSRQEAHRFAMLPFGNVRVKTACDAGRGTRDSVSARSCPRKHCGKPMRPPPESFRHRIATDGDGMDVRVACASARDAGPLENVLHS